MKKLSLKLSNLLNDSNLLFELFKIGFLTFILLMSILILIETFKTSTTFSFNL